MQQNRSRGALAAAEITSRRHSQRSAERSDQERGSSSLARVMLLLVMLYLLVPLGATLVFGLDNGHGYDLTALSDIVSDPDFSQTLIMSLELAAATTLFVVALVTPTVYWMQLRLPQARPLLELLSLLPFAVPAIVLAVGLLQEYGGAAGPLVNLLSLGLVPLLSTGVNVLDTPLLLVCSYGVLVLPFVYRPLDNSLRAIHTRVLTEAAYSLGCGWWRTFLTIILPNIWPGVISAALLTFSTVMGEFTLASLFNIYTFPIYLNVTGQNDPHKAAVLSILSFIFTLLCVLGILLSVRSRRGAAGAADQVEIAGAR